MSRAKKVLLAISSIMFILMLTVSIVLNYFNRLNPAEVVYPKSELTDSIFDSQNTEYVSDAELPNIQQFDDIAYLYDSPDVNVATIDDGKIYSLSNGSFIYVTSYSKSSSLEGVVAHELGQALLIDLDESQSLMRLLAQDEGFINGFSAKYVVDRLIVTNGKQRMDCNLVGYNLMVPNASKNVFICAAYPGQLDTSGFDALKRVCRKVLYTFRYSQERADSIEQRRSNEAREAADEQAREANALKEQEEREAALKASEPDVKYLAATLSQDYANLQLTIYWDGKDTPEVRIYNPDKTLSFSPSTTGDGEAVFRIGAAQKGTWIVEVTGSGYGECSMEQAELSQDRGREVDGEAEYDSEEIFAE